MVRQLVREPVHPVQARDVRSLPLPRWSFWLVGAILSVFLMASTAPSPLYSLYQRDWGFSPVVLTEVFAIYNVGILLALVLFGSLSDHIGRKPVLLGALAVETASLVVLAAAPGVGWLSLGRLVQGLATGAATSAVSGALLDLQPPGTNRGATFNGVASGLGLAMGGLLAGVLVQFAPAPKILTYVVLLIGLAAAALAVFAMPEPSPYHRGPLRHGLRPRRPQLPAGHRLTFALLATTMLAAWTVGGMYMSLGPSVAKSLVDGNPYLVGGLAVALVTGIGALTQLALARLSGRRAVRTGTPLIIAGLAGVSMSVLTGGAALFFGSSAILAVGWGLMFMGGFRMLIGLAGQGQRAGTAAMIYVVAYVSAGIPAVTLGLVTTLYGLAVATVVFAAATAFFAALAGFSTLFSPPSAR